MENTEKMEHRKSKKQKIDWSVKQKHAEKMEGKWEKYVPNTCPKDVIWTLTHDNPGKGDAATPGEVACGLTKKEKRK